MAWDPTVPATSAALLSAPIRENFAALDALMAAGPATPYPLTTLGDLFVGGVAGAPGRLGIGTTGQRLTVVAGVPAWQTVAAAAPAYPLLAPDGTAAAPSYSFASDPGTGLWRDGSNRLSISIGGTFGFRFTGPALLSMRSDAALRWTGSTDVTAVPDLIVARDASGTFAQRNSVNPQTFRLYNTFTDPANGEWLAAKWTSNIAFIQTEMNGSGVARDLYFRHGGTAINAIRLSAAVDGGIALGIQPNLAAALVSGRVAIAAGSSTLATSGTSRTLLLNEVFSPTATSTMIAQALAVLPTINYSNATPGAGSYEALKIAVTETALPTGQSYMIRASGGAAGTMDRFAVLRDGSTRIYGDYTDGSNHSYLRLMPISSTVVQIGIQKAGSGTLTAMQFDVPTGGSYEWRVANAAKWQFSTAFHFLPSVDNAHDIGSTATRVRNVHLAGSQYFAPVTAPATPAASIGVLYMKADKKLYFKDDAGLETALW